jgi:hypothetical protein
MARMFPACYPEVGPTFLALADELRAQIQSPVGVNA